MAVSYLAGCGSKGDLALEPESLPLKISSVELRQIGYDINLRFKFPETLSDQSGFDPNRVTKLNVYHSTIAIPEDSFRKKGKLILKYKQGESLKLKAGGEMDLNIPFDAKALKDQENHFAILYYYGKKRSPISTVQAIKTVVPIPPIRSIDIVQEKKNILLKWKKASVDVLNNKITRISGYNIYRMIVPYDSAETKTASSDSEVIVKEPVFVKLNKQFISRDYFEDMDISTDGKYQYRVAVAYNSRIESEYSKIVSIDLKDIYPPDTPENFFAFKGDGFMLLNWEAVGNTDLSHYRIFRRTGASGQFRMIADNITVVRYKDTQVRRGVVFHYYIVAVDQKGNESERSAVVKERY